MAENIVPKPRLFPDGAYYINSKIVKKGLLCISKKHSQLVNGNTDLDSNKLFIFKYIEKTGHYSIMAFHSHKYLGVKKKIYTKYRFSSIFQYSWDHDHLFEWDINLIGNSLYTLELVDTDLFIEIDKKNLIQLNDKSCADNYQFSITTCRYIENGLYMIESKSNHDYFLSFTKNQKYTLATFAKPKKDKEIAFYIHFDKQDGCYWIINFNTFQCLTSSTDSCFYQNPIANDDNQKFIIMPDKPSDSFRIELKSNLLRLELTNYTSPDDIPLSLNSFMTNTMNQNFIIYHFKLYNDKTLQAKYDDLIQYITKKYDTFYLKSIEVNVNTIDNHTLCNNYFIEQITIPNFVCDISKDAFINCQLIESIECDPKWLTFLPNPLKVEEIYVNEGVTTIDDEEFKDFSNLYVLSLPSSLVQVSHNAFVNNRSLKIFIGNLQFINLINTTTLTEVVIPSYIKRIPEKAFAECRYLHEVSFKEEPNLEIIESKAFENCISLDPETFKIPSSVTNIAPDAFFGCKKDIIKNIIKTNSESQKLSMLDNLIIDPYVTYITEHYSSCYNIESLEIPLTVDEIEDGVFDHFNRLKYVKCDPKWLKCFPHSKIEVVFIPHNIEKIYHEHFERLPYLNFVEIPNSVEFIEENAFESCHNLTSFKCSTKHLPFLDQQKITSLFLNKEVKVINQSHFQNLVNLEKLVLHNRTKIGGIVFFYTTF